MDNKISASRIPLDVVKKMIKRNIDDINKYDVIEYRTIFTNSAEGDTVDIIYEIEILKDGNREIDTDD